MADHTAIDFQRGPNMTLRQIHVSNGTRVQTLAAVEGEYGGVTLLSTLGTSDGLGLIEIHIPASARPWLAEMAQKEPHAPISHEIETTREQLRHPRRLKARAL